ncbi:hypothetical protein [Paragemmobacter straminiformis]|uniref:Uncharacterized protein n=1 Tax=Paragemmobacter straminiformis TaxID=2045119 RepID=A0A842IAD4_9RHOB|nr:hypothetical protein [Gemmobacter straminiformis]MBC2836820.1 hypothetical protein [Gemmobacter straminiformis]
MKFASVLVGLAAVAVAGVAHAQDMASGISGDFSIARSSQVWGGDNTNTVGVDDLSGRVLVPLSGPWALQVEGNYGAVAGSDRAAAYDDNLYLSYGNFGAHALYRAERFQAGVMAAKSSATVDGEEAYYDTMLGLEGQTYFGNATVWGQVASVSGYEEYAGNEDLSLGVVRGGVRYFIGDATRIDLEGTYAKGTFDDYDAKIAFWGVGVEHQIVSEANYGVSVFARYEGSNFDFTDDYSSEAWLSDKTIKVGLSIKFGGKSLREADRSGANTDLINAGRFNIIDSTY